MPRKPRIDSPGLLHHIIARGIDGHPIFRDDKDRLLFMERLALVLEQTKTTCFAYALIPNHFHLLLRTGEKPIATSMRKLLTSYAINFNVKHKRRGHLFQNRYKDIICQKDPYLLELIRYINLNSLRAHVVQDISGLNKFAFCSHKDMIKKGSSPDWFGKDEILSLFGKTEQKAINSYRRFILEGIDEKEDLKLEGGGLRRSLKKLPASMQKQRSAYDDRILGDSDFVLDLLKDEEQESKQLDTPENLAEIATKAKDIFDISEAQLTGSNRSAKVTRARAYIAFIGTQQLGISAAAIARRLGVNRSSVTRLIEKGAAAVEELGEEK